jgi:hypothetical protein
VCAVPCFCELSVVAVLPTIFAVSGSLPPLRTPRQRFSGGDTPPWSRRWCRERSRLRRRPLRRGRGRLDEEGPRHGSRPDADGDVPVLPPGVRDGSGGGRRPRRRSIRLACACASRRLLGLVAASLRFLDLRHHRAAAVPSLPVAAVVFGPPFGRQKPIPTGSPGSSGLVGSSSGISGSL